MHAKDIKPITVTKKLEALLDKYHVIIRSTDSMVEHELTKETTIVPPVEFAVFEAAMNAVYSSNMAASAEQFIASGQARWYAALARKNGIALPTVIECDPTLARASAEDYRYCLRLIVKAGLYYALLD